MPCWIRYVLWCSIFALAAASSQIASASSSSHVACVSRSQSCPVMPRIELSVSTRHHKNRVYCCARGVSCLLQQRQCAALLFSKSHAIRVQQNIDCGPIRIQAHSDFSGPTTSWFKLNGENYLPDECYLHYPEYRIHSTILTAMDSGRGWHGQVFCSGRMTGDIGENLSRSFDGLKKSQ